MSCTACIENASYGSRIGPVYLPWKFQCGATQLKHEDLVEYPSSLKGKELFDHILGQVADKQFLPQTQDPLVRLVYLTTLKENADKSPFRERQVKIFKRSARADRVTLNCLRAGLLLGVPLVIAGQFMNDDYVKGGGVLLTVSSVAANFFQSCLSYASTGTNPRFESNAANDWQNLKGEAQNDYLSFGATLLDMYHQDKELAKQIVAHLDFKKIGEAILRDDPKCDESDLDAYYFPLKVGSGYIDSDAAALPENTPLVLRGYANTLALKYKRDFPKMTSSSCIIDFKEEEKLDIV